MNYGLNRGRFTSPPPVGSRVRLRVTLNKIEQLEGAVQVTLTERFEREGSGRPVFCGRDARANVRLTRQRRAAPHASAPDTEYQVNYEQIEFGVADGIAAITLNRPEQLNADTNRMMCEVVDALDHSDADDTVRTLVFTSSGPSFCAGADLSEGWKTFESHGDEFKMATHADGGGILAQGRFPSPKPLVAAINGAAVGVGVTPTLPVDFRLASRTPRFGFVFASRGVVPEACSSRFLPRVVGSIEHSIAFSVAGYSTLTRHSQPDSSGASTSPTNRSLPPTRARERPRTPLRHRHLAIASSCSADTATWRSIRSRGSGAMPAFSESLRAPTRS